MAGMIYLGDEALESVAPVLIEDVRISPIQLTPVARQRPVRFGAQFVRLSGGTRTVAITFGLLTEDMDLRALQLMDIARWARADEAKPLRLPGHDGVYLEAICTALPEPSTRQWWESKLRLIFTCFDNPYWTGIEQKSAACGTAFNVLGTASPLMRITRTLASAATNQSYSRDGETMSFSTIPAGNLVIDLERQTAAVDGTSIMQYFPMTGATFLRPKTGLQTITGTGTITWRERWE